MFDTRYVSGDDGYTRTSISHVIQWSQGPMTLGHKTMVAWMIWIEKGIEPLVLVEWKRNAGGDSRRPSWSLGLRRLHLKYYMERALKRLLNLKPSTTLLGPSHIIVHVILWLTDA